MSGEHLTPSPYASRETLLPLYQSRPPSPSNAYIPPRRKPVPLSSETAPPPQQPRENLSVWCRAKCILRAFPAAAAFLIWTTLMTYFLFWFVSRPSQPDGSWARIGASYAAWPFISCIGQHLELAFRLASISVACMLWTAFGIDYHVGKKAPVGRWLRLGKAVCASISSVFLIALSFYSVDKYRIQHLVSTSLQIFFMASAKGCDWFLNRAMRRWTPHNRHLVLSKNCKRVAGCVAFPMSVLLAPGIYGCAPRVVDGMQVLSGKCWTLVSFAAPSEWILSSMWVLYIGTVAYDNYYLEYTVQLLLETPPLPPRTRTLAFWKNRADRVEVYGQGKDMWLRHARMGSNDSRDESNDNLSGEVEREWSTTLPVLRGPGGLGGGLYQQLNASNASQNDEPDHRVGRGTRDWLSPLPVTSGAGMMSGHGYRQLSVPLDQGP